MSCFAEIRWIVNFKRVNTDIQKQSIRQKRLTAVSNESLWSMSQENALFTIYVVPSTNLLKRRL